MKAPVFDVQQTGDSIQFIFSSTLGNIDHVCDRTAQYLRPRLHGVETQLFPIHLAMREGLTNAVRHGNANDPAKTVRLILTVKENTSVRMVIEDQGDGFDWRKQQAQQFHENGDHGRGIFILNSYLTHYHYNDKGNILYLEQEFFPKS